MPVSGCGYNETITYMQNINVPRLIHMHNVRVFFVKCVNDLTYILAYIALNEWFSKHLDSHSFPLTPDVVDQPRHVWCPDFASLV